jgi:hypothetical protein
MNLTLRIIRITAAAAVVVWIACRAAIGQEAAISDVSASPSNEQITTWVAELDSNRYLVRERATQELLSAGVAAVEPLLTAANSGRPEPADRAIWIMRQMAETTDGDLRRTVLKQLVQVESRPQVVAEARAALATIDHDVAVLAIEQLGGRYLEDGIDPNWGQQMPLRRVILDDEWRGGDEGVAHLTKLRDVPLVIIMGSDVTRTGVAQLAELESLRDLQLYGTRLDEDDLAVLQKLMPGVTIDFRRGALLGVRGIDGGGAAVVQSVQPGTAAAAAGIQSRDVIRRFNGEPVANFADLTGKIAKCMPGDRATLEIVRDNQAMDVVVSLGRWKSR